MVIMNIEKVVDKNEFLKDLLKGQFFSVYCRDRKPYSPLTIAPDAHDPCCTSLVSSLVYRQVL